MKTERLKSIQRDIAAFADPGTVSVSVVDDSEVHAQWGSNFGNLAAAFKEDEGNILVTFEDHEMTYQSFLASSKVANLMHLARNAQHGSKDAIYVPTLAETDTSGPRPAVELLETLLEVGDRDGTRVLFITADAGSGKTWVLRELVRRRAQSYIEGTASSLFLYVNAQGRALADLHEAMAIALDDVRARFPYPAVAVLCREGLLLPIVDGFDELIGGASGHDEGFASLASFMDDLDGNGQVVAAARSTFYHQEFIGKGRDREQAWTTVAVRVLDWGAPQRREFVSRTLQHDGRADDADIEKVYQQLTAIFQKSDAAALADKPFFVAKALNLLLKGVTLNHSDLLKQLVQSYAQREVDEKIVDKQKRPLTTVDSLTELMIVLATEMWLEETRELDIRTVRELTSIQLGDETAAAHVKTRMERGSTMLGFLTTASRDSRIEFEHELFYGFFLAVAIQRQLSKKTGSITAFLGRGILPPRTGEMVVTNAMNEMQMGALLSSVSGVIDSSDSRAPVAAQNCGSIVLHAVRLWPRNDEKLGHGIRGIDFVDVDLKGVTFVEWTFEDVVFRRVRLAGARFEKCFGSDLKFIEPLIDPANGLLDISGIEPFEAFWGLRLQESALPTYEPSEIRAVLVGLGFPAGDGASILPEETVPESVRRCLERLMRGFQTTNIVWPGDDQYRAMTGDDDWELVLELLVKHGVLREEEKRQRRGQPRLALRILPKPEQVLEGAAGNPSRAPQSVIDFWDDLRSRF